jgi:hypothetical protein
MKKYVDNVLMDMTQEEIDELNNINFSPDNVRRQRNDLLKEVVDTVVSNPLRWESLSVQAQENFRKYRQQLLDVPQQEGFPRNVVWPVLGQ